MSSTKKWLSVTNGLILFFALNALLYLFIVQFNQKVEFNKYNYLYNAHHFLEDPRVNGGKFNLFRALGQYDSQWYLKIASFGYPKNPSPPDINNKSEMGGATFAFFPLYPIFLSLINILVKNIEVSAFLLSNISLIANFISLTYIVGKLYKFSLALKTAFLLFLFPFGIFFRSYYPESLLLLFLTWFSFFLIKKNFLASSIFLSLMNVTKGNLLLLNFVFFYFLYRNFKKQGGLYSKYLITILVVIIPFSSWIIFNYLKTGNPIYFYTTQGVWYGNTFPGPLLTIYSVFNFPRLPFHSFHFSQVEIIVMLTLLVLLIKSKKYLLKELWFISFFIWLAPLFLRDTMSFTRYQSISFPLFIYLAYSLKGKAYWMVAGLFFVGLFITSLFFVNWYWVG
ncbi:hypothetical protein A2V56_02520 [Candidatus Woesebacteria bacterium RBG_19FT_COMBO_42_9]|uniref:Glycosyltransferase RgtA/B/C/D-like domain-containing protein n=1 Tax=Candidatus Woesebacteria bacterium RBG_16_42_24 TaxID=1802485 RepID=A0A1F7XL55_9BACT|nr:MAG: hypothetical protein A2V97_03335 [Candidatus Woesebacteria bacterium RBG_16_42_24]OGM16990.1 MAG: hypothetical protein A2V56_02520 [Candidatus Woesebacteria bacterium RBG_19FT_COMBO_42_9]OGM68432.1 MAG: hypothetical protein A2985_01370 [Candidatus Woesebacteria bacterium RIFCSPLOWO2_01_FULL_43_11]